MSWKSSRRQFLQQSLLAAVSPAVFVENLGRLVIGEPPQSVVSGFQKRTLIVQHGDPSDCGRWFGGHFILCNICWLNLRSMVIWDTNLDLRGPEIATEQTDLLATEIEVAMGQHPFGDRHPSFLEWAIVSLNSLHGELRVNGYGSNCLHENRCEPQAQFFAAFLKGGEFTVEHAESTLAAILAETNSVKGESSFEIERFAHEVNQLTTTPKCQR